MIDNPTGFLRHLFDVAVDRARPGKVLAASLPAPPRGRTVVLGAGKAAAAMAAAVEAAWPAEAPLSGLVVTRYGHIPAEIAQQRQRRIEIVEASHPVPDAAGLRAAERILALARTLGPDDLALCLISGGGSALLSLPAEGLTLADKQAINQALLHSGADIGQMNCVRKHLSAIKGGRLAQACAPARIVSLLISDVPGDDPDVIASGPTVPDSSSCADALAIIDRYALPVPPAVRDRLRDGSLETPKAGHAAFADSEVKLIATPQQSLQAAAEAARAAGIDAHILGDSLQGESRDVGYVHAALARQIVLHGQPFSRPCVLLSGGETTVTVRHPDGRGGRAVEFALATALALQGIDGVWGIAADTDGIDGSEDHAGAIITPDTLQRAQALRLNPRQALDRNDVYPLFLALNDLVISGPTATNVNDFRALLID